METLTYSGPKPTLEVVDKAVAVWYTKSSSIFQVRFPPNRIPAISFPAHTWLVIESARFIENEGKTFFSEFFKIGGQDRRIRTEVLVSLGFRALKHPSFATVQPKFPYITWIRAPNGKIAAHKVKTAQPRLQAVMAAGSEELFEFWGGRGKHFALDRDGLLRPTKQPTRLALLRRERQGLHLG